MSLNFLFNNGLGPGAGGCNGQSAQNCSVDLSGCCTMPAGPVLSSRLGTSQNVSFRPMSIAESVQYVQAQKNPALRPAKSGMVKLPSVPMNGVGVV